MLFEGTHWQLIKVNKISDNFYKEEQLCDCLFIWMTKSFQNEVYFYRKHLILRSKFPSIKELTSIEKGNKTENGWVISPENVFLLFKDKGHRFRNVKFWSKFS